MNNFKTWKNWEMNSSSLMYAIAIEKRFDHPLGLFNVLTIDDEPVACGGCSVSDWSNQVMVLGVRTWTNPKNRDYWWHGDILLPLQFEFAKSFGCVAAALTFNEYSAPLKKFIHRIIQGKAVSLGAKNSNFYKDLIFYNQNFLIKNTIQTIAIKLLNCTQVEFEKKHFPPEVAR